MQVACNSMGRSFLIKVNVALTRSLKWKDTCFILCVTLSPRCWFMIISRNKKKKKTIRHIKYWRDSWSLLEAGGCTNTHARLIASPREGARLLRHQTLRNSSTAAETFERQWKDIHGVHMDWISSMKLSVWLSCCYLSAGMERKEKTKGYVNLKRVTWLNKD